MDAKCFQSWYHICIIFPRLTETKKPESKFYLINYLNPNFSKSGHQIFLKFSGKLWGRLSIDRKKFSGALVPGGVSKFYERVGTVERGHRRLSNGINILALRRSYLELNRISLKYLNLNFSKSGRQIFLKFSGNVGGSIVYRCTNFKENRSFRKKLRKFFRQVMDFKIWPTKTFKLNFLDFWLTDFSKIIRKRRGVDYLSICKFKNFKK